MLQKPTLTVIPISAVVVRDLATRVLNFQHVAHLADSLRDISQFAPIVVRQDSEDASIYHLWDGAHRLCAAEKAGLESVHAHVFPATATDEHVRRCVLECEFITRTDSWAIKALKLQELKSLYEQCYPHTAQGKWKRNGESVGGAAPAFVKHLARESGISKSTISDMLTLVDKLGESVLRKLDACRLPKQIGKELLRLSTEDERLAVIEHIQAMSAAHRSGRRAEPNVATALHAMEREKRAKECAGIELHSSDAQVIQTRMEGYADIADGTIDAIITDPLYHSQYLPLYGEAAQVAARVLKPGGFAAFYCGKLYLDKVMSQLGEHLDYKTLIVLQHKQHFGNIGSTHISGDCKYILVYQTKGAERDFYESVKGVIVGTGMEKGSHVYQQSISDLDNLIDAISQPGDVILDMFAGSGSTGVAAILKARRTILLEEDEEDCAECRARLNAALAETKTLSLHPQFRKFLGLFDGFTNLDVPALRAAM